MPRGDPDCDEWNQQQEEDRRHEQEVYDSYKSLSSSEREDRIARLKSRLDDVAQRSRNASSAYESREYDDEERRIRDEIDDLERSGSGGGCYLTTAAVNHMGEADNGYTLTTLRDFRDKYMKSTPEGQQLVQDYYKVAPGIVDKVNERQDSSRVWDLVYREVGKCVSEIEAGKNQAAQTRYVRMTKTLERLTE